MWDKFPKSNKRGGCNEACSWDLKKKILHKKQQWWQISQKLICKRGGSIKACSWENSLKKNKKYQRLQSKQFFDDSKLLRQ